MSDSGSAPIRLLARLTVALDRAELLALERLAIADYRHIRDQARFLIREGLYARGLLLDPETGEDKGMPHASEAKNDSP